MSENTWLWIVRVATLVTALAIVALLYFKFNPRIADLVHENAHKLEVQHRQLVITHQATVKACVAGNRQRRQRNRNVAAIRRKWLVDSSRTFDFERARADRFYAARLVPERYTNCHHRYPPLGKEPFKPFTRAAPFPRLARPQPVVMALRVHMPFGASTVPPTTSTPATTSGGSGGRNNGGGNPPGGGPHPPHGGGGPPPKPPPNPSPNPLQPVCDVWHQTVPIPLPICPE